MNPLKVPKLESISIEEAKNLIEDVSLLIITATPIETKSVLNYFKPLPERELILKINDKQTYHVGKFGVYRAIHVQSSMGATRRDGVLNTTRDAIDFWKPKAIVMIGIGFGKDEVSQKLGDVLVSETVAYYEFARVGQERQQRGPIVESGRTLLNRAKNHFDWEYTLPNGEISDVQVGQYLSGEKLIDDQTFKEELFKAYPSAIGGDMEAYGVASAANSANIEWIVIKSICDWGTKKQKDFQQTAADVAASFCCSLFSDPHSFSSLGLREAPITVTEKKL